MKFARFLLFTLPECLPHISLAHPAPNPVKKRSICIKNSDIPFQFHLLKISERFTSFLSSMANMKKRKKKGGESGYRSWYLPHAKQALYHLS